MADISLFFGKFRIRVPAFNKVSVAKRVQNFLTNSGHNSHIQNDVNRVGDLYSDFREFTSDSAHRIRNNVHGSAFHNVLKKTFQKFIRFVGFHPVIDRRGIVFILGTDKGSAFYPCDVVDRRAVKIATGQFFLIKFDKNFLVDSLLA